MEFRVLGPLGWRVGDAWAAPAGPLQASLLGALLTRPNHPVSADHLIEVLWGSARDEKAAARLQVHVHRLRRALGESERLAGVTGGYKLLVDDDELDANRFEALADKVLSTSCPGPSRIQQAREALELWTGDAYAGLQVEACRNDAQRLDELRVVVSEALFQAEIEAGRSGAVVPELVALAERHPLRESLQAMLMKALFDSGRQSEALEVYRRTRTRLVDDLGVEPSAPLREVHEQVLAGSALRPRLFGVRSVPAQLPATPAPLYGRDTALAELDLALGPDAPHGLCVLSGTAGVGKTSLALTWAHGHRAEFSGGQLFADLRGFSPTAPIRPDDVLDNFLRALGTDPGNLRGLDERSAQFRSLVDGRQLLIVLDNARDADQVRPLLPGTPGCCVLVTSRQSLPGLAVRDGARRVDLDLLTPTEAEDLLTALLGDPKEPEGWAELASRCAYLPLALRVAAERLRADLGMQLTGGGGEPSALDLLDAGEDHGSNARTVFSWSVEALRAEAANVFRAFGMLPGSDTDLIDLAALAGYPVEVTRTAVAELVRAHLVDKSDERYRQHDLLAEYAAELANRALTADERTAMDRRLLQHYVARTRLAWALLDPRGDPVEEPSDEHAEGPATPDQALAWLRATRVSMVAAAERSAADDEAVLDLATILRVHLRVDGQSSLSERLHIAARDSARRHHSPTAESRAEGMLGDTALRLGDLSAARVHLERSMELARRTGEAFPQAAAHNGLAVMQDVLGYYHDSLANLEQALELCEAAGDDASALIVRSNIGVNLYDLGRLDDAEPIMTKTLVRAQELGLTRREAMAERVLAQICSRRARFDDALTRGRRARELAQSIGDRITEGQALEAIGTTHLADSEPEQARIVFEELHEIARELGECQLMADSLAGLAMARAFDDPLGALPMFEEAVAFAARHEMGHREATTALAEAGVRQRIGEHAAARRLLVRSLDLFEERRLPEAVEVRRQLRRLSCGPVGM